MGMLHEMFGSESEEYTPRQGEFLGAGEYESNAEQILKGYKVFQKKYVYGSMIWKMIIVAIALTSSVMMIMNSQQGDVVPVLCLMLSIGVGVWFISVPITNAKNLRKGLDSLEGAKYKAEFYTDKVKISTLDIVPAVSAETDKTEDGGEENPEDNEIPATIIHLDTPIVDLLEKEDMYILVVKKAYVFIIPKSAFSDDDNARIRDKLSAIMGIRYKDMV